MVAICRKSCRYWILGARLIGISLVMLLAYGASQTVAADSAAAAGKSAASAAGAESGSVDFFDAMNSADLGVQFIPRDSREATLTLSNNTDGPLHIRLPEAFAAVPVLAQAFQQGGRNPGAGGGKTGNQPVGGSMTTQRPAVGFGGAFDLPPERVLKIKLTTVCLEYGKQEPTPRVKYTVVPIDAFTTDLPVQELCRLMGSENNGEKKNEKIDQQAAQAAAWHLANHLSWDQLTDMKHFPHNRGFTRPVFTAEQIHAAMALADKAIKAASERSPKRVPAVQAAGSAAVSGGSG